MIHLNVTTQLAIRPNLRNALRRLRSSTTTCTLWADAVCINQVDMHERSQQVPLMRNIYKRATRVVIWLGEYAGARTADIQGMRLPHTSYEGNAKKLNERGRAFAVALESALQQTKPSWYDRTWVVQEFLSTEEAYLCFGPLRVQFDFLLLRSLQSGFRDPLPCIRLLRARTIQMLRLNPQAPDGPLGFARAALETTAFTATRPHDNIFGLLGLVDPREARLIPTDYSLTAEDVFALATYASISVQGNLGIMAQVTPRRGAFDPLPSWALNFGQSVHRPTSDSMPPQSWFEQSYGPPIATLSQDQKRLRVWGCLIGQIEQVSPLLDCRQGPATLLSQEQLLMLAELLQGDPRYLHGWEQQHAIDRLSELYSLENPGAAPPAIADLLRLPGINISLLDAFDLWDARFIPSKETQGFLPNVPRETPEKASSDWMVARTSHLRRLRSPGHQYHRFRHKTRVMLEYAETIATGVSFISVSSKCIGVALDTARSGDVVALLHGAKTAVILRPSGNAYAFEGFAYVHRSADSGLTEGRMRLTGQTIELC